MINTGNLENADSIIINSEKEFVDLFEWGKIQGLDNFSLEQIPMESAKILIEDKIEVVFIDVERTVMFLYLERDNDVVGHWFLNKDSKEIAIASNISNKNFLDANVDMIVSGFTNFWKSTMMYMLKYKSNTNKIATNTETVTVKTKRKANRKRYTVYINKSTYTVKSPISKKKVNWKPESWGVRGHIRKLKNGKEIFVRPYTKGKGKRNPKDYKL
ncbi:hypothetical protein [Paenibacillus medicaginis]|uniref:Uncharacterized protein n=1 Tax=Paenibacillus medicaginis TaxID=1470560 RepID=A0ABV5BVL2_9BACL